MRAPPPSRAHPALSRSLRVAGFLLPVLCEKRLLRVARSRGSQVWPGHHTGTVDTLLPGALHCSVSPSHLFSVLSWGPSRPSLDPVAPMLRSHPASPSPHRASPTLTGLRRPLSLMYPSPHDQMTVVPPRGRETGWKWFRNVPRVISPCKQERDPGRSCPKARVPACFHALSRVNSRKDPKCPRVKITAVR